ncbi:hypothetical protein C1646_778076 [Rhizophagus diaphanus]|nr:hypothetical protein C1646_778076 [Rhizophagus diaphanus] [Rhizophagus sp. MUCL 43196]
MQFKIDETDSLKICIARLEVENAKLRKKFAEIEARNAELKARIAKLEDRQTQNELIKNLLSVSHNKNHQLVKDQIHRSLTRCDTTRDIGALPESLIKRACERLLHHSKDPVPLEAISEKSERIESYLRHTLEVYENSLNRKCRNMAQEKVLRPRSWPECSVFPALPAIYVTDIGVQTNDYEEENNCQVMNELKVFCQHLLDYNKRTFEKFMQDIERKYRERISMNKKLRCENEDLKMQLQEVKKKLASMKSDSSH